MEIPAQVMKILWDIFDYGGDEMYLAKEVYPALRDLATFYAAYVTKGEDGCYHVIPTVSAEHWGWTYQFERNRDSTSALCMFKWTFRRAAEAAGILGVDAELARQWTGMAEQMAPYPTWPTDEGPIFTDVRDANPLSIGYSWFAGTTPTTLADEINLDSSPEGITMMLRTARKVQRGGFPDMVYYLLGEDHRFLPFYSEPAYFAESESERLLNSRSGIIHLFPCVPRGTTIGFRRFQARNGFLVSAEMRDGVVSYVLIESRRDVPCKLANPWPDSSVTLIRDGQSAEHLSGRQLHFVTRKGECIEVRPNGNDAAALFGTSVQLPVGPDETSDLKLAAPIDRWDEAIPLGNDLLGGLVWGEDSTVRISLDRGDLWDLRRPELFEQPDWNYGKIQKLVGEENQAEISRLFDAPYDNIAYPTKLPVGRLELRFPSGTHIEQFTLSLKEAVGRVTLGPGQLEVLFSAVRPVLMLKTDAPAPEFAVVPTGIIGKLGYPPPEVGRTPNCAWSLQETTQGASYAIVAKSDPDGHAATIAVTIACSNDGPDPLQRAHATIDEALKIGYARMLEEHRAWWKQFWSASSVRLPDKPVQQQYDLVQYFYGAASRRGAPPIPLQGVWTADEGTLPPWKGDYHHDLNTQLTYWAYLTSGHFEEGACFLDFMWNPLPEHRKFAEMFYHAPGAAVPGVMDLAGKPMGGWSRYTLSPMNGAWVAHAFYLHWRYTMDTAFLRERAYPYMTALAECFEFLLKPDTSGKLKLPLSSSPEIHRNSPQAWLTPNSNYDLSLLRWHFGALVEMAHEIGDTGAAARWQRVLNALDDFALEPDTLALRIAPDESLTESHRHHSHIMPIHPLGLITIEGSDRDRRIIDAGAD